MFEQQFDFWLAKKIDSLYKEGYNTKQVEYYLNLIYEDLCDIIDDEAILLEIRKKMKRTMEIFIMGE